MGKYQQENACNDCNIATIYQSALSVFVYGFAKQKSGSRVARAIKMKYTPPVGRLHEEA